ncbi:protein tespa1 [Limosa lapponica baueri]|uniref:Protein tespa1 n=1 Tax=Limosa lapponica baueri TaxID=1758121 RepID=A0A2I0T8L2_LIMLA|nr:protein tespa1 [Limosa lapponica baueri]
MASSALSSLTTKTSSSISEVLEWWQADAEEILYNLGFVQSEPEAVSRVPARFFSSPSRAKGIDFQLFLKAQVQRMEMEDPCLMLARSITIWGGIHMGFLLWDGGKDAPMPQFPHLWEHIQPTLPLPHGSSLNPQQVQALAATADAFFCLYSYVSRTPVQRISPSRLTWPCPHVPSVPMAPPQPTALSPVERLKKAVATMCLYTSPREEDSPRGTDQTPAVATSQPSALGKVVQEVLERAREERFRFEPPDVIEGRDTETVQQWRGVHEGPPVPPSPGLVEGVPACLHHGGSFMALGLFIIFLPPYRSGSSSSPPDLGI